MTTPTEQISGGSARGDYQSAVDKSTRNMLRKQQQMTVDSQNAAMLTMINSETAARVYADGQEGRARIDGDKALSDRIDALGNSTAAAINNEATLRSQADTAEAKARADADALRPTVFIPGGQVAGAKLFLATGTVQAGQITFNLAAAGFSSILTVQPSVNDASTVHTFSWTISPDLKSLVLAVRKSATPLLSLLGVNILAAPTTAPNGTSVQVMVVGN